MATKTYDQVWESSDDTYKARFGGDKNKAITAMKDWNTKKYNTTEPTSTAKNKGITKPNLASRVESGNYQEIPSANAGNVSSKNVDNLVSAPKPDNTLTSAAVKGSDFIKIDATNTKNNASIQNTVTAATQTRKEKRFDRRTDAGRRTKEITTDNAGTVTKTIRKGKNTKKTVTRDSGGNKTVSRYRNP
jgi:hypothetical protein|tara:strand:- start:317 stop:883 length:567 start_codon:yes stop_codon:yes gene_type:complete